jgi:hypothetical protein
VINDNTISPFWNACHVAIVHEVCSLNLYAMYFFRFVLPQCVNLKCTHPFDGFYWDATIRLEGCIGNLKRKNRPKKCVREVGEERGVSGTNHIYVLKNVEVL